MVVVSHCADAGFLPGILGNGLGQVGVCMFYTLSGFLMAYLYAAKPFAAGALHDYAVSRAARVLPLYYTVLAASALALRVVGNSGYEIHSTQQLLEDALLIHGTSVLWSIPVEIQFYVVFVFIWFAFSRGFEVAACIALLGLELAGAMTVGRSSNLWHWGHFFLIGVMAARLRHVQGKHWIGWLVLLLALGMPPDLRRSAGLSVLPNYVDPFTAGWPVAAFFCALLGLGPFRLLAAPIMRWFGTISFSLYLLHKPVIDILKHAGASPVIGVLGTAVISIALAALSQRFIERPAQALLRRGPRLSPLAVAQRSSGWG